LKKVHNFKNIYMFISKILKTAHFKITRNYAKTTSLRTFIHEYFNDDPDIREEMQLFCDSWNELAKKNYALRYRCHDDLGELPEVTADDNLKIFLPDNKHSDNRDG